MKRTLAILASSLAVAGCMSQPGLRTFTGDGEKNEVPARVDLIRSNAFYASIAKPVRLFPMVYVDNNKVVVDQEPIHVLADEGVRQPVFITWSIGDGGSYFPSDQSVTVTWVSGPRYSNFICNRQGPEPATKIKCRITRPAGASRYSYSITVSDGSATYTNDPYIASD